MLPEQAWTLGPFGFLFEGVPKISTTHNVSHDEKDSVLTAKRRLVSSLNRRQEGRTLEACQTLL